MLPSSRALLSPLLLLIIAGSAGAFSSRQGGKKTPFRRCFVPKGNNGGDGSDGVDDNEDEEQ
ncbi:hypothetical protein K0M31_020369 [Melipona bicolor]|uniref:Uncharacterized protein n=1 Tax=Melipona bicolor TaxID=60889 RepID=A0AA40G1G1_9HYME|nr:hypothetical protein K0M31_020369 [Melipona bicolor]